MKNSKTVVGAVLTTLLCVPVSRATTAIENDKNIDAPIQYFLTQESDSHQHEKAHEPEENHKPEVSHQSDVNQQPEENHQPEEVVLTEQQRQLAGVQTSVIEPRIYNQRVYAPGEVKVNGYSSSLVSTRTDSVVISRHAALGDEVAKGQVLVTLFSETIAQSQAEFLIASSNYSRAKKLDKNTISESALVEAENRYKASYGELIAFGLTPNAISSITALDVDAFGQYELVAVRDGVVLQDDFMQGQRVLAGETVMLLADESDIWIEASLPATSTFPVKVGDTAQVIFNGEHFTAQVIQQSHIIDPLTRTRTVRLAIRNTTHSLHAGMFVDVLFSVPTPSPVMAVPETAMVRSTDGDWVIYVENEASGAFTPVEVQRGEALGEYRRIEGVETGTRIVTHGAFFVASELAKSGFDPHNH